jgi:hypothetical protein
MQWRMAHVHGHYVAATDSLIMKDFCHGTENAMEFPIRDESPSENEGRSVRTALDGFIDCIDQIHGIPRQ